MRKWVVDASPLILLAKINARALGISYTGTVGVVLAAKHEGMIPNVGPLLNDLVGAGLRISEDIVTQVRRLAGEL